MIIFSMAMQRFMLPPAFCPIFGSFEKNLTKNAQKFWRFKKLSYLCIAFSENGRLAQLVQSVCLTSRGSGVRIPQRPQNKKTQFSPSATAARARRALSSAGSERLPYKQRVGGSNPSAPTHKSLSLQNHSSGLPHEDRFFYYHFFADTDFCG